MKIKNLAKILLPVFLLSAGGMKNNAYAHDDGTVHSHTAGNGEFRKRWEKSMDRDLNLLLRYVKEQDIQCAGSLISSNYNGDVSDTFQLLRRYFVNSKKATIRKKFLDTEDGLIRMIEATDDEKENDGRITMFIQEPDGGITREAGSPGFMRAWVDSTDAWYGEAVGLYKKITGTAPKDPEDPTLKALYLSTFMNRTGFINTDAACQDMKALYRDYIKKISRTRKQ